MIPFKDYSSSPSQRYLRVRQQHALTRVSPRWITWWIQSFAGLRAHAQHCRTQGAWNKGWKTRTWSHPNLKTVVLIYGYSWIYVACSIWKLGIEQKRSHWGNLVPCTEDKPCRPGWVSPLDREMILLSSEWDTLGWLHRTNEIFAEIWVLHMVLWHSIHLYPI